MCLTRRAGLNQPVYALMEDSVKVVVEGICKPHVVIRNRYQQRLSLHQM